MDTFDYRGYTVSLERSNGYWYAKIAGFKANVVEVYQEKAEKRAMFLIDSAIYNNMEF